MDRLLNLLLSAIFLAFTAPLFFLVSVAIKWESPGPVFERRVCIGRGGRRFEMLSFRVTERDQARARWAQNVTRIGALLQFTRIEMLPRLINVLRGDIGLINMGNGTSF
jgi:lipopolysaccharide/colanic/teichoic acid biosynthesis glycosyltransferase